MSAGCAACGACCDPVIINADVLFGCNARARSEEHPVDNDRFITQHWHPESAWTDDEGGTWIGARCDAFDPETLLCTAHNDRPPVCRDYPWYGEEPGSSGVHLFAQCSYQADLPPGRRGPDARPLIPITVIPAREAA